MEIPAIRAKIGDWVYYTATLSFSDIVKYVKPIDKELHASNALNELLQRNITENFKNISNYILQQKERFFNSIVLAVYDGDPQWHEVRLSDSDDREFYDLGLLELTGTEKIFPVDGQHRVEGIKEAIKNKPALSKERIPVIFVGHKLDKKGMERSRRLFSTLNRYAKPVSLRDIIALDEDDVVAIVTRNLIESNPLFAGDRLADAKTKAISSSDSKSFTTIITLYECNRELLSSFLDNKTKSKDKGKRTNGNSNVKAYIKVRPEDDQIDEFGEFVNSFWKSVEEHFSTVKQYAANKTSDAFNYRNREGGFLLFRPAGLIAFLKATVQISKKNANGVLVDLSTFPQPLMNLDSPIWKNVLWNSDKGNMIPSNAKLVKNILIYLWDNSILSEEEEKEMKSEIKRLRQFKDISDVDELLKAKNDSN